ncbi:LOW QUALITY PROTEIN: hypothetical protein CVT25_009739 [Psilocybe cyanescens]|uniref:F-box domain-containing protein n=1 Tax=Psilocybe cyanescens TaxID=93625 RepID=A0A409XTL6_PSICY|nr:LOW QUALITY PROTEIN: hypothetical protein CVT25_009739 [Psilocybe cyanescens]
MAPTFKTDYATHIVGVPQGKKTRHLPDETPDENQNKKHQRDDRLLNQSKFLELPMDTLNELVLRLQPIELFHLALTSNAVRATLMSRSSMWLRRNAFSNISEFAECPFPLYPHDLNLPQYTYVVFDSKTCHYCLDGHNVLYTCWAVKMRACVECIDANLSSLSGHGIQNYQRRDIYLKWRKELKRVDPSAKDAWIQQKAQAKSQGNIEEGVESQVSVNVCPITFLLTLPSIVDRLRAKGIKGWGEELAQMSTAQFFHRNIEELVRAAWCVLSWESNTNRLYTDSPDIHCILFIFALDPFLIKCVEGFKQGRLKHEREIFLQDRLPVLCQIITNASTGSFIVSAQTDHLLSILPGVNLQWQAEMKDELVALISSGCGSDYVFGRDRVLHLATTAFTFSDRSPTGNTGALSECLNARTPNKKFPLCHGSRGFWCFSTSHWPGAVESIWGNQLYSRTENLRILSDVVTLCGKNPQTTTLAEMNAAIPILECVSCNDPSAGRGGRLWCVFVGHLLALRFVDINPAHVRNRHRLHSKKPLNLELLDEDDVTAVRDLIESDGHPEASHEIVLSYSVRGRQTLSMWQRRLLAHTSVFSAQS